MKPITVVVSVPVADIARTLSFYRDGLGLQIPDSDDKHVVVELPNLSLFLIEQSEYATYTRRGGIATSPHPTPGAVVFSCAFDSREAVDRTVEAALQAGGSVAPYTDADDSYIRYLRDPDGHVWELVCNATTRAAHC